MVQDAAALDTDAVAAWMERHGVDLGRPVAAEKFAGGQSNPTFRLRGPLGAAVLRRKPPGRLLKSAHAVDREFRVQSALAGTAVPVPRMLAYCDDGAVIGSDFYVMSEVAGRNFEDPRLPGLDPGERAGIFDEINRVLVAIHEVDPQAVGLGDYGPPGDYYRRQIDRWTRQYRASETEEIAAMDALIAALGAEPPREDGQRTLVHGDYRLDNMIFASEGTACAAVIDWELSTIGHPYADLAQVIMQWRRPPGPDGRGLAGEDRAALGLPDDEAFVALYCERRGIGAIEDFGRYLGFTYFRMAAILQGVKKRALDGNASNPQKALGMGRLVPGLAAAGLEAMRDG